MISYGPQWFELQHIQMIQFSSQLAVSCIAVTDEYEPMASTAQIVVSSNDLLIVFRNIESKAALGIFVHLHNDRVS